MNEGYLRPEEFLFGLVTSTVIGLVMRLPQPQQASLGGVPMDELVGYSLDTFASALDLVEAQLEEGQSVRVQLCTDRLPTEEELADIFLGMAATGSHVSMPSARMAGGVPTTEFAVTKGSPIFLAIIPVLAPLLTIGLIAWGITKIENITRALVPIVLISLGGVIVLAALARQPAAKYIERGGRVPLLPMARRYSDDELTVLGGEVAHKGIGRARLAGYPNNEDREYNFRQVGHWKLTVGQAYSLESLQDEFPDAEILGRESYYIIVAIPKISPGAYHITEKGEVYWQGSRKKALAAR